MALPTRGTGVCLTPGDGEGQGSLVCCRSWGRRESDTTERLNNTGWESTRQNGTGVGGWGGERLGRANRLVYAKTDLCQAEVKRRPCPLCLTGDPDVSLRGEDPLEEGMATHSGILACRIP